MSRELAWTGGVALLFGLAASALADPFSGFARANLTLGGLAVLAAVLAGLRRGRGQRGPEMRRAAWISALRILGVLAGAVFVERAAAVSGIHFDWSPDARYAPSPALVSQLAKPCEPLEILLFGRAGDPRLRRSRLWLDAQPRSGDVLLREFDLADAPREVDRYGVGGSNQLVVRTQGSPSRFERVERPADGTLFEALLRICATPQGVLLVLRGDGEGDLDRRDESGHSGLAAALEAEGYSLRGVQSAALGAVPDDVAGVLVIAPERPLPPTAIAALRRYLETGGRLIALLEPGAESGLETLLADRGIESPDPAVIDRMPGATGREAAGFDVVVQHYETHPITSGLDAGRATFLPGVRSFALRKPQPSDRLRPVAWSGPAARLEGEPDAVAGRYLPLAVTGRYVRSAGESRIFAVGDADFSSNRHLRTLYNLDLILGGVRWALGREPAAVLRPKLRESVQFPLPMSDALRSFFNAGLLLPELLTIAGGIVWLRRSRS